ncbi:RNA 2',3'-cyclic phosphodiesterase [Actinoplanes cyaneus]|uniref:RNA 2',3'-cyclic phosphodiesterase n=1 Tax=Actinoplanes cyaneus TaxID=52696 RepID=A0A919MES0_9ACTN|nr:RNA 2',3'-cyclic phosphodiesterase [Actinoplanes cyaneus]MCW2141929.1 2'-5' RNA ligase [Actinoplanes cyaneus]GID68466.1 RNA 2',3'-cyclic phosphodiesterase [Actinoplanes cyaneus]
MAVYPPVAAREDLLRRLPSGARLTRPAKWHVTLAFLGELSRGTDEVADTLATVPAPPAFPLRLSGGGRFGSVVWAGLTGNRKALTSLRESVRLALDNAGFPIDPRPFRPHLTVSYRAEPGVLPALESYTGPSWPVTSFALVESVLGNYHTLHEWPLPTSPTT